MIPDTLNQPKTSSSSLGRPLGVVIPTKNCRDALEDHLRAISPWLPLASEVIVVDSFSSDGTVDYLRKNLVHPNVRFYDHPPGLYASWNFGISQVTAPYFFMATAGDLITEHGIRTLMDTACKFDCDVVISKPDFRDEAGHKLPDSALPVDDVVSTMMVSSPIKLNKLQGLLFTAIHPEAAILGNSASNIYKTETMKRFPFPLDFGKAGDGAWGYLHAPEVTWGVVGEKFSTFTVHPSAASHAEKKAYDESKRPDQVMKVAMEGWMRAGIITEEERKRLRWDELLSSLDSFLTAKIKFDKNRHSSIPWILRPDAWRNRMVRTHHRAELERLKREILADIR